MSDGKVDIPQAMILAAARALRDNDGVLDNWLTLARAVLAAAFAECEVTEQLLWSSGGTGSRKRWENGPAPGFGRVYARRLVVVTPAQEGQDEGDQQ